MYGLTIQEDQRRGIHCKYCGKPVRLLNSLLLRAQAIEQNESGFHRDLQSKVFPVRCKRCRGEAIYAVNQIVDL